MSQKLNIRKVKKPKALLNLLILIYLCLSYLILVSSFASIGGSTPTRPEPITIIWAISAIPTIIVCHWLKNRFKPSTLWIFLGYLYFKTSILLVLTVISRYGEVVFGGAFFSSLISSVFFSIILLIWKTKYSTYDRVYCGEFDDA